MKKKQPNDYLYMSIPNSMICFHQTDILPPGHTYRPYHRHDAYEIYYFVSGDVDFYIEQHCYHLNPGDLVIVNTTENHRMRSNSNAAYERYVINIKPFVAERLSTDLTNLTACFQAHSAQKHIVSLSEQDRQTFISLYEELHACTEATGYGQDVLLHTCIAKLLVFINTAFQSTSDTATDIMPELIKDVMDYVHTHLSEDIKLSDIGHAFYLNSSYISQRFKHYTGLTLREYIIDQRIVLAKTLLLQGMSVTEACEQSGFNDYSNFIRTFTKSTGISPGKYQKSTRQSTTYS